MLFGYPVAATKDNWLHDCLVAVVKNVHATVDDGKRHPAWPKIVPRAHQAKFKLRAGLCNRVKAYDRAIRKLSKADRDAVLAAVEGQNRIPDLLAGTCDCAPIGALPHSVREPVKELFGFAFDLLTDLTLRDQHYAAIYSAAPEHICPFCGTEYFDPPGAPREALDHYLTRSRYPFAAANLRNLVPMGRKCNSSYKLAIDVLYQADGTRRVAFDPYNHAQVSVVLDDSDPFDGATPNTPQWQIRFNPDSQAAGTWDDVFSVRERFRRDHLDPSFANWLGLFGRWARQAGVQADTDEALLAALRRYEEFWTDGGMQDRAFLKAAVFRMLRRHCENGHQRLKDELRSLVAPPALAVEEVA